MADGRGLVGHQAAKEVRRFQAAAAIVSAAVTTVFGLPAGQADQTIRRFFDYLVLAFIAGAGVFGFVVAWLSWRMDYATWLAKRRSRDSDAGPP